MSDFVQTMKDWRRMCKFYTDKGMEDGLSYCACMCSLGHSNVCGDIEAATDTEIEDAAKAIEKWAKENPEPVYPTWTEYFRMTGVFLVWSGHEILDKMPIPADIAQKLGIEPKEG